MWLSQRDPDLPRFGNLKIFKDHNCVSFQRKGRTHKGKEVRDNEGEKYVKCQIFEGQGWRRNGKY